MDTKSLKLSQDEKIKRIYQALNDYYTILPDRQSAPSIVVTQNWEVFLNYEGEPCDSDFTDDAVLFMEDYEAEEWVYTKDTIGNCIPYIERELDAAKKYCLDIYGEVPTHEKNLPGDLTCYLNYIYLCISIALRENNIDDWILEIDLPTSDIYLIKNDMRSPSYGGLILHYAAMKFVKISECGEKIVDIVKVRELAERICREDFTGEFANDDNDEGGDLYKSLKF